VTVDARVLLTREELRDRVRMLAARVTRDHPRGVVLVGVLKGALVFAADLAREISSVPVVLDFLAISRYAADSGRVRILKDLDLEIAGSDVVVVEDLVDTGLTLAYLLRHLGSLGPRSLRVCALLDRTDRRIVPTDVHYVGEELAGDTFVVGYGLHVGERYRNLPYLLQVDRAGLEADPSGCLEWYRDRDPSPGATGPFRRSKGGDDPEKPDARVARELERRRT
jgi:hypoxanthine phosphoribosyltransferase